MSANCSVALGASRSIFFPSLFVCVAVAMFGAGCLRPVCDRGDTVGCGPDGGPREAPTCGGQACASGLDCCLANGKCFDPLEHADECPPPPLTKGSTPGCSANSQCKASESCVTQNVKTCQGTGICVESSKCDSCGPVGSADCAVCGCDGVTYGSMNDACAAGVRATPGACGVPEKNSDGGPDLPLHWTPCGKPGQCPSGAACCPITGRCFLQSESWRCEPQPDGGLLDCSTNADCRLGFYCASTENCTAPGKCTSQSPSCGGEKAEVCGCDQKSYTNACWARYAGTRVAKSGACP